MSEGYLLVRSEGRPYGLPLARVLEVNDGAEVLSVPRALDAMRGLTPWRGRLVPLVHLGALLGGAGRTPPAVPGQTTVVVQIGEGERYVAFEVDDAEEVVRARAIPMPPGESLPWASGVAQRAEGTGLVPILDFAALEERFA
jgi:chemotaxis signal transduction protein